MRKIVSIALLGLSFAFTHAMAADAKADDKAAAKPKQQTKMAMCNQEAGDKKGDERKKFMSECLKNKQAAQQNKMKTCNAEAKDKKGDERKKFMSECLKG